jgi:hypothetical protein
MRQISVSTEVFAAIWAQRRPGEETEDEILVRLLQTAAALPARAADPGSDAVGFEDPRYGLKVPTGFRIFRTYRGVPYSAVARSGRWFLNDDGDGFRSLNELSKAVGAKIENAWMSWNYERPGGEKGVLAELRRGGVQVRATGNWRNDVEQALKELGGEASLSDIYEKVRDIRIANDRSIPASLRSLVRKNLEEHCAETESYTEKADLFIMPRGKGSGYWGLKKDSVR